MAIKTYRPITPTLRFKTTQVNDDLTIGQRQVGDGALVAAKEGFRPATADWA